MCAPHDSRMALNKRSTSGERRRRVPLATPSTSSLTPQHCAGTMPAARNTLKQRKSKQLAAWRARHRELEERFSTHRITPPERIEETKLITSAFRALALSRDGLIHDKHRRRVWSMLTDEMKHFVDDTNESMKKSYDDTISIKSGSSAVTSAHEDDTDHESDAGVREIPWAFPEQLRLHPEWNQVHLDVVRTLQRFPPNIEHSRRLLLQDRLTELVVYVLQTNPKYKYYQGFHDVCLTLLIAMDDSSLARDAACNLAQYGIFRRFLIEPLELSAPMYAHLIYVILWKANPELELRLRRAELGHMFALPWLLTWYAHCIDDYNTVVRLYDLFIASHHLMPIYFAAALLMFREDEIERTPMDMPSLHSLLTRTMPNPFPLEAIIADALELKDTYPPAILRSRLREEYDEAITDKNQIVVPTRTTIAALLKDSQVILGASSGRRALNIPMAVCAVTATAAAWYITSKLGSVHLDWNSII